MKTRYRIAWSLVGFLIVVVASYFYPLFMPDELAVAVSMIIGSIYGLLSMGWILDAKSS